MCKRCRVKSKKARLRIRQGIRSDKYLRRSQKKSLTRRLYF